MIKLLSGVLIVLCLGTAAARIVGAATAPAAKVEYQRLPQPGEKISLDVDHYFIYGFAAPPKLGTAIMRVEIFTSDGKRDTSFAVRGDADMPSMRGAHSSGDMDFALSAKGVYLLPVRLVMPGDWEVRLTFMKKVETVFRGVYLFDL